MFPHQEKLRITLLIIRNNSISIIQLITKCLILLLAAVFLALLHSSSLLASERTVEEVDS